MTPIPIPSSQPVATPDTVSDGRQTSPVLPQAPVGDAFDHRVAVLDRPGDPDGFRRLLEESLGLNRVDSGFALAQVPGLLPQKWTAGQARHVAEIVAGTGIPTVAVPGSDIPDFDHSETVYHIRCRPGGLEIADLDGEFRRTLAWENLCLLSIGRVPLDETRTYKTNTILRASPVLQDSYVSTGQRERLECWLVFVDPLHVLRFDSGRMRYELLDGEVPTSGTVNFELLAASLLQHVSPTRMTPATRAYCNHAPVVEYDFSSSKELQRYSLVEYLRNRPTSAE